MSPHPPLPPPARWPACASWTSARSSWAPTPPRCWATWARTWSRSSPRRRQPARGRPHAQSRHGPSAPAPEPQQALDRAGPEDARGPRGLPSAGRGLRRPALQHPPQAMARLGLSYEAVAARNPRIVYLGAYGFGEQGPYAGRPAYDDLIQGQAGIAALYARQSGEVPRYAPLTLADRAVGLHAAIALVSAVLHARASGRGQQVEIPMFEGMAHMTLGDHLGGATFDPPLGPAGYARLLAPHRRPYATADGYLCLLIYNDKHWRNFRPDRPAGTGRRSALAAMARAPRTSARSTPSSPMSSATAPRTTGWPIWRAPTSRRPACTPSKTCWMTNTWPPPVSSARRTTPPKAACARPRRWAATPARPPPSAAPPRAGPAQPRTAGGSRLRRGRHRRPVRARRRPFSRFPGTPGTPDGL